MNQPPDVAPRRRAILRTIVRLVVVFGAVWAVKSGLDGLSARIALLENDAAARAMTGLIATVLIGYALLIAIPFVPGIEIGIAILMIQGAAAAPFVYLATLTGMSIAFLVGQFTSLAWLIKTAEDLYLFRICSILQRVQTTSREDRLTGLNQRLPRWLAPVVVSYRYVTLGLLINIPGNIAVGGGGGIMMTAGISRLFHPGVAILTVALATLPVPLIVWLWGTDVLYG